MIVNPYEEQLKQLVLGDLQEVIVEQADFLVFREAWLAHPQRKEIVGEAGLNGRIVYRFLKEM
ncbi:hypothetical protein I6N95_10710 [Vagococcus sp. BWB3-3]|uniref:Uncharacterized protein n=1 Tax=Vagococcus allomyrinae TaxID=2794353 RepID=A0A940PBG1_9ENTE|nr:hypothetical protein [Vagococcus allomyrinae]MBP1041477.1 hypothetical protein [Vagococcus allomyrinae]